MLVCWVYCDVVMYLCKLCSYVTPFTLFSLLEIWNVDHVVVWLLELLNVGMLVGFIGMW
jgi:hypothetical protein